MEKNEEIMQVVVSVIEKYGQIVKLISLLDDLLKSESGKPYSLLDLVLNEKNNPLQTLMHNEHYYDLSNLYPNILWSSIFLTAYSIFEKSLMDICNSLQDESEDNMTLNEIKDKGIVKAKIFIKKVKKLSFPDDTKEWSFLNNSNTIRNCLIHGSGDLLNYDENHKVVKFIKSVNALKEVDNKLIIEKEFPLEFIKNCISIIDALSKQVQDTLKTNESPI
ncbi:MAG: hypothetical protein P9L97_00700 [Candidatus Tenebribacter davisii]|nr:hypothetical protein [Candidatus Tenebribacter davisii]